MIIGVQAYKLIAQNYHVPCVIAGFEPADILQSITMLVEQIEQGREDVEIAYKRGVTCEGNKASEVFDQVFEPADAHWRGLGMIPQSGLRIRDEYMRFDVRQRFDLSVENKAELKESACGEMLCGILTPFECALFGKACTPDDPIGPRMVSKEWTCADYHKYYQLEDR